MTGSTLLAGLIVYYLFRSLSRRHPLIFSSQIYRTSTIKTFNFLIDFNICKFFVSVYN